MLKKLLIPFFLLIFCFICYPSAPASSTSSGQIPVPDPADLDVTLSVQTGEGSSPVEVSAVLRYLHVGPLYGDGIVFTSPQSYAMDPIFGEIGSAALTGELTWSISVRDPQAKVTAVPGLFKCTDTGLAAAEAELISPGTLGSGRYLWVLDISVERGSDYASYYGFLWLTVE
ncbi:MAG: hypothetical protein Q4G19_01635 [Clostridia bacterium]|nr:hypothetical protein [Clostridia bacterium]